jgi:hypothetical protein
MNGPATVIGEQPSNMSLREQVLGKAEGSIDPRVRKPANCMLWNLPEKGEARHV